MLTVQQRFLFPLYIHECVSRVHKCLQDSWTALHIAAKGGRVDIALLLTEAQAEINKQSQVLCKYKVIIMYPMHIDYMPKVCIYM